MSSMRILREKAAERNPDEFSYGMLSSKIDKYGRKIQDRGNTCLSQDAAKLLKTQDAGYISTVIQQTKRTRERMEQEYILENGGSVRVLSDLDRTKAGSHVIFAESAEEQRSLGLATGKRPNPSGDNDMEQYLGEDNVQNDLGPSDKARLDPRQLALRKAQAPHAVKQERVLRKLRKRGTESRQSKLNAIKARERNLLAAQQQLDHQRARMSNSMGGVNKAGVGWKVRERKR
ncbi:MAG: hypothetical protein Q9166_003062 [cf. Caloplaca sp. 2 TL-2023]